MSRPHVDLDRVELEAPAPRWKRALGTACITLAGAAVLAALVGPSWVDTPPDRPVRVTWTDAVAQPDRVVQVHPVPDTLDDYARLRGDALYAMARRDLPLPDLGLADVPDDTAFLEALNGAAAHLVHLTGEPLPPKRASTPTRGLVAEREAYVDGEPNALADAVHEVVDREVTRAQQLAWIPEVDGDLLRHASVQVAQWDWTPLQYGFPQGAPLFEFATAVRQGTHHVRVPITPPVWPRVAQLAAASGAVGLFVTGLRLRRRRRIRLSAAGLDVDGIHVPIT
jgi:hypothetical protein